MTYNPFFIFANVVYFLVLETTGNETKTQAYKGTCTALNKLKKSINCRP